ncbi:hypothetical protein BTA30_17760, partial [Bacillus swezeyi]
FCNGCYNLKFHKKLSISFYIKIYLTYLKFGTFMTRRVKKRFGYTLPEWDFHFFMSKLTIIACQRELMDLLFQKNRVMMLLYETKHNI